MATYSVTSGEVSNGITLSDGDFLYVSSGGYAAFTTVLNGGSAARSPAARPASPRSVMAAPTSSPAAPPTPPP
jgi:hypothetical protein